MRTQTRGKFENVTGIFPHFPDWNFPAMRFIWERQRFPPGNIRRHWYSWQMAEPTGCSAWKRQRSTRRIRQLCARHFDDGDIAVRIVQALADKKGYHGNRRLAVIIMHLRNSSMTSSHRDCGSIWIWSMYTLFCRRVGFPLDFYNVIDPDTNQDNG